MNAEQNQPAAAGVPQNRIRLATLVRLRWLAVAGQATAVLYVAFGLGYALPLGPASLLIAVSACFNVWLQLRFPAAHRLRADTAALQLAYDTIQLAGLLCLTGGLQNPFSMLFLAPVSVSATTLPSRFTLALSALVVGLATVLVFVHLPLPWAGPDTLDLGRVYTAGIWVALGCGVAFISVYTNRVAHEARQLADALTATEMAFAREQQISALDGLAAAAAHELGTPLATIALAAREMQSDPDVPEALGADIELIAEQSARCRDILGKLRSLNAEEPTLFSAASLGDLIAEVAAPHRAGVEIDIETVGAEGPEPVVRRNAALIYGLGNLIENAVDFAASRVTVSLSWTADEVTVRIVDDGPGFPADLITRLGEPYVTSRQRGAGQTDSAERGGLGLGIFIAKTLLERTGGRLGFTNEKPAGNARVTIAWPRARLVEGETAVAL